MDFPKWSRLFEFFLSQRNVTFQRMEYVDETYYFYIILNNEIYSLIFNPESENEGYLVSWEPNDHSYSSFEEWLQEIDRFVKSKMSKNISDVVKFKFENHELFKYLDSGIHESFYEDAEELKNIFSEFFGVEIHDIRLNYAIKGIELFMVMKAWEVASFFKINKNEIIEPIKPLKFRHMNLVFLRIEIHEIEIPILPSEDQENFEQRMFLYKGDIEDAQIQIKELILHFEYPE